MLERCLYSMGSFSTVVDDSSLRAASLSSAIGATLMLRFSPVIPLLPTFFWANPCFEEDGAHASYNRCNASILASTRSYSCAQKLPVAKPCYTRRTCCEDNEAPCTIVLCEGSGSGSGSGYY